MNGVGRFAQVELSQNFVAVGLSQPRSSNRNETLPQQHDITRELGAAHRVYPPALSRQPDSEGYAQGRNEHLGAEVRVSRAISSISER
jgi:hypothetical protein